MWGQNDAVGCCLQHLQHLQKVSPPVTGSRELGSRAVDLQHGLCSEVAASAVCSLSMRLQTRLMHADRTMEMSVAHGEHAV